MTLQKKMMKGAVWSFIEKVGQQGLSFIVFMVLARLVGPDEYGLANICFVYSTLSGFIISGVVDGIVSLQIKDDIRLSTMFWGVLGLSVLLSLFSVITAVPMADLMNQPKLANLLYWFSIIPILMALSAIPNMLVMSSLNFKVYALRTIIAALIGGGVGLAMAHYKFGAYAVIAQQIVLYFVMNVIIWPNVNWKPLFIFDANSLKEMVKPGLNMLWLNITGFIDQQVPRLFIGRFLGTSALGYYAFIIRLQFALQDILVYAPLSVFYPALSKINHDKKEQQLIAGKLIVFFGIFFFPIITITSAAAPIYVPMFFGKAWEPAILALQIYIMGTFYLPFTTIIRDIFRANNALSSFMKVHFFFILLKLSVIFLLFFPDGLVLMGIGVAAYWSGLLPIYVGLLDRRLGINLWKELLKLWPSFLASALTYLAIYYWRISEFYPLNNAFGLLSAVLIGLFVYVLACIIFQYRQTMEILIFVKNIRAKKKSLPVSDAKQVDVVGE